MVFLRAGNLRTRRQRPSDGTQGHICDAADASGSRILVPSVTLDDLVFSQDTVRRT